MSSEFVELEIESPELTYENVYEVVSLALSRLNIIVQCMDELGGRMKIRANDQDDGISATIYWPFPNGDMEEMSITCEVPFRIED